MIFVCLTDPYLFQTSAWKTSSNSQRYLLESLYHGTDSTSQPGNAHSCCNQCRKWPTIIVTELHDILLRKAYKNQLQGSNKLGIFWDVASALNYLYHYQWGEIIHRDVSSVRSFWTLTEDNKTDNSHLKPAGPSLIQVLFWQPFSVG